MALWGSLVVRKILIIWTTYCAQNSGAITNKGNVAERLGIASDETIANSHRWRRDARPSINDRRTNDVGINVLGSSSLKHEGIGLAIEHVFVHSLDVVFIGIIPYFAVCIEVSRCAKIDEISATANVQDDASGSVAFFLLAGDDRGDWVGGEGVAGVHCNVMLTARLLDLFKVAKVAENDAIDPKGILGMLLGHSGTHVCSHRPVWVCLLDGLDIRSWNNRVSSGPL